MASVRIAVAACGMVDARWVDKQSFILRVSPRRTRVAATRLLHERQRFSDPARIHVLDSRRVPVRRTAPSIFAALSVALILWRGTVGHEINDYR